MFCWQQQFLGFALRARGKKMLSSKKGFLTQRQLQNFAAPLRGPATKHLISVDEKLNTCFSIFSRSRKKAAPFLNASFLGYPARANSDSFSKAVRLSVVCEQNAASCLMARTLKRHRVVAVKMAPAVPLTGGCKAKEWAGSSRQSHGFNPLLKDSCSQKKRDIQQREIK